MKWPTLEPDAAKAVLEACAATLSANGRVPVGPRGQAALEALAQVLSTAPQVNPHAQLPDDLGARVPAGPLRQHVMAMLMLCVLVDATLDTERLAVAQKAGAMLGETPEIIASLASIAKAHVLFARLCIVRRIFRDLYHRSLWQGFGEIFGSVLSAGDGALVERYRALEKLPADTYGRQLFAYYEENQYRFPGEPHNPFAASITSAHDARHVLAGWNPSFVGETFLAAFESGASARPQIDNLLAIVIHGYLGIEILEPAADLPQTPLDVGALMAEMARGAKAPEQILRSDWNFWEWTPLPISEVRAKLGVAPGGNVAAGGAWSVARRRELPGDKIALLPQTDSQLVAVKLSGKLTSNDVEAMTELLARRAWGGKRLDLLIELEEGAGAADFGAVRSDFGLALQHRSSFRRIAIVGSGGWQRFLVALDKPFAAMFGAEERFFPTASREEALAFARGPRP